MGYEINTLNFKIVSEYTMLNFLQIRELALDEFLIFQKDGYIYKMQQSAKGQEYLENCKRLETTDANYQALREIKERGL